MWRKDIIIFITHDETIMRASTHSSHSAHSSAIKQIVDVCGVIIHNNIQGSMKDIGKIGQAVLDIGGGRKHIRTPTQNIGSDGMVYPHTRTVPWKLAFITLGIRSSTSIPPDATCTGLLCQ